MLKWLLLVALLLSPTISWADQFGQPDFVNKDAAPRVTVKRVSPAVAERLVKGDAPVYVVEIRPSGPIEVIPQQKPLWKRIGENSAVLIISHVAVAAVLGF